MTAGKNNQRVKRYMYDSIKHTRGFRISSVTLVQFSYSPYITFAETPCVAKSPSGVFQCLDCVLSIF